MDKKILNLLTKMETVETAKLSKTTLLAEITNKEVVELLEAMYNAADPLVNKTATVLNAMFTQKRVTFLLSKKIANDLILEDSNHKFKGINSTMYKLMIHKILSGWCFFHRLREPSKKQAGVLELIEIDLLEIMYRIQAKEFYEAQRQVTLDLYDNYESNDENDISPDILTKEEIADMKIGRFKSETITLPEAVLTPKIIEDAAQKEVDNFGTIKKEKKDGPRKIF